MKAWVFNLFVLGREVLSLTIHTGEQEAIEGVDITSVDMIETGDYDPLNLMDRQANPLSDQPENKHTPRVGFYH